MATGAIAFSFMYDSATVGGTKPLTPLDLVGPKWKGKIASSYPHNDDAVFGGQKAIGVGTAGSAVSTSPVKFAIGAGHPFIAWGQRTAVLKQAKNSTAAKLFLNWQLSTEMQNGPFNGWSAAPTSLPRPD